jgi:hypothetical protein
MKDLTAGAVVEGTLDGQPARGVVHAFVGGTSVSVVPCEAWWFGIVEVPVATWSLVEPDAISAEDVRALWTAWESARVSSLDAADAVSCAFEAAYRQVSPEVRERVDVYVRSEVACRDAAPDDEQAMELGAKRARSVAVEYARYRRKKTTTH